MHVFSVRSKRQIIAFCYHVGVVMICIAMAKAGQFFNSSAMFQVSGVILLAHLLTFRIIPVSRWLQEWLIPEAVCPGCGTAIDLVGIYRCGCGFVPHKERHVFSPCPMCGKLYSWVVCPLCETSILV